MTKTDYTYEDALRQIMGSGIDRGDRTGTGTRSLFGLQMRWHLAEGFPLVTTQQAFMQAVQFSQKLVERGVGTYNERLQGSMPDTFRSLATKNELQTLAPASQHEAARPLLDAMQQNFMRANPDATPAQVAQAMQGFLHTLGQQFAPQSPVPTDPRTGQPINQGAPVQNWADYFSQ